eukprot:COSAG04_NODE_2643_length_3812_cov_2.189604_3_plen_60_part_00
MLTHALPVLLRGFFGCSSPTDTRRAVPRGVVEYDSTHHRDWDAAVDIVTEVRLYTKVAK